MLYVVVEKCKEASSTSFGTLLKQDYLVPTEISSGKDFEYFVANWLVLRIRRGASLESLIEGTHGDDILRDQLNISGTDNIKQYFDECSFVKSLPEVSKVVKMDLKRRPGDDGLFGAHNETFTDVQVAFPSDEQNVGFDFSLSREHHVSKHALLVQTKALLISSAERGGCGQTIHARDLESIIKNCAKSALAFHESGWTVSLLVLCACQTDSNIVTACPILSTEQNGEFAKSLQDRCCVIAKAGLRDLLGPSFALALELAQGKPYDIKE